jgi:N utilization substance protein B
MKPSARVQAREYALQALYQWTIAGGDATEIEQQFLKNANMHQVDTEYFSNLLHGVITNVVKLDEMIMKFSKKAITALSPVELSVLRLATYELMFRPDVPAPVVINEALELTKNFGSIEGHKFVNGVLDKIKNYEL